MSTEDVIHRACVACDAVYHGGLACPACGEPGEPLEAPERKPRNTNEGEREKGGEK